MTWVIVLLLVIVFQLWGIGLLIRRQTAMIQSGSDLNLEAQNRLLDHIGSIERIVDDSTRHARMGL